MKGLWSWASEKISSIKAGISYTYSVITSTINTIISSPSIRNFISSFALKGWEGATRFFDPYNVTKVAQSTKTRSSLKESFKANVIYYLSLALLYEMTYQAMLSRFSDENDSWAETSLYTTISIFGILGLGSVMLHRLYENLMINLALTKQVTDENPTSHHYKPCGCDEGAIISAGLFSSVNLSGKLLSIWIASFLPLIKYLTPLAYAFAYGESLAELPYSSVGVCTADRARELAKHNAYSLGIGASLYGVGELISFLIYRQTGVNSFFINNAVYAAIYPWFVTSVLLRDRPLPGNEQGTDFFYYHRYVLQHMVENISKQILPLLQNANKSIDWKKRMLKIVEFSPVCWTRKVLSYDVYGNWHSLDGFLTSPANMVFVDEYYDMTKQQLDKVIDLRDKPVLQRPLKEIPMAMIAPIVPALPDRITRFVMTDEYKRLIKIVFDKWLEDPLKNTREGLDYVRKKQEIAKIRVVTHDLARLKEVLAQAIDTGISSSTDKPGLNQTDTSTEQHDSTSEDDADLEEFVHVGEVKEKEKANSKIKTVLIKQTLFLGTDVKQENSAGKTVKEKTKTKTRTTSDLIRDDYVGEQHSGVSDIRSTVEQLKKDIQVEGAASLFNGVDKKALLAHNMHASASTVPDKRTSTVTTQLTSVDLRQTY